jgi:tetratricopeptide (TPR) repeat protein
MSILDGMPSSQAEFHEILELAAPIAQRVIDAMNLSPKAQSIMKLMREGMSLADICGITKEERDALFMKGCNLLRAGNIQEGRDWLTFVHHLEPLDARVIYAIAASYQAEGNVAVAGKLYVHFIALNAANPEGHLRLGECFLSAREYDLAIEHFQIAKDLCERGHGDASAADLAVRLLVHACEKQADHDTAQQTLN